MGCSTFSNFTVLPEIAVAKIREDAPFQSSCYIGCGVTTGVGAVVNTARVEPGANVVVFGLGGIGLNVVQGARLVGADRIVGVDINPDREEWGRKFGMTDFVDGRGKDRAAIIAEIAAITDGGADYSFDCTGNTEVMRTALECCTAAGANRSSSASPRPARKSPPVRSSWSPAGCGRAPPSAARAGGPTCRASSTGTWTARSPSTR
jgi:Zn-dependent alcohol dehydrogenase